VRLLLDTNIVLEVLLEQANANEARTLLSRSSEHDFYMSDFSVHSLGVALFRRKQYELLDTILQDLTFGAGMLIVLLRVDEIPAVADAARMFNLDFDDAYQYVVAEKYDLAILSFDTHFDRTERGRVTPANVLSE
jgi:predicted nucleic acid-binding protein